MRSCSIKNKLPSSMVNIPHKIMDDYGTLEPTDVGNMTIDYDAKDDAKMRRMRWDPEEVICMLNLIKENNYASKYSAIKMANFLTQQMTKEGWNRTQRQIHMKIATLKKNYLTYERLRLADPTMKECAYYRELREIYRDVLNNSNGDAEEYDSGQEEASIKFPNDPIDWSKEEVQKMLNIIKSMKLKNELTLTFFSPVAVRMISEAMHQAGYDRGPEQVKNALINLRTGYIDYKIGCENNENPPECLFLSCLELFWSREFKKSRLKEKKKIKNDDFWSTEETIVLLTMIQDLRIAEEAYKNTEKAAEVLRLSLSENNYNRSKQQIMDKLDQLKLHFISIHEKCAQGDALRRFPFYNLYKKLFERQISRTNKSNNSQSDQVQNNNVSEKVRKTPSKQDSDWSKEEIKLLLKTVRELTLKSCFNDSLEDEKLKKLTKVLREDRYFRTAEQIKNKLALLKDSYLKCNLKDGSKKDAFECPFYNELHDIFKTPVSDEKYEHIQNISSENIDPSSSKFSDHSYNKFNIVSGDKTNNKVTVIPNNETWFPGESVVEEEVVASDHISEVTSFNHEQPVLPKNDDMKVNNNVSIAPIPGVRDVIVKNDRTPAVSNGVRTLKNEEHETCDISKNQPNACDKSQKCSSPIDAISKSQSDDDGPPSKKLRIVEDDKLSKKILLRPVEMNQPILNVTNTKFVRLIVANDQSSKSKVHQISAHIEPLNANPSSSVSSGMSSPVEKTDILKLAAEKALSKEDFEVHQNLNKSSYSKNTSIETTISETIKEAVQSMMKHDELLQQRHHAWMEKQFETQRKHDDEQRNILMNELKELRSVVSVLLDNNKQPQTDNKNR